MTTRAYLNRVSGCVPRHDVHQAFLRYFEGGLEDPRQRALFQKLARKSQIESRWSCLAPAIGDAFEQNGSEKLDGEGFYRRGHFPSTAIRMARYEQEAPGLAVRAVRELNPNSDGEITHFILTSCTGFYAPGLDVDVLMQCGLNLAAERTIVGFMGCNAAMNALKLARHIVRSEPKARVLIVSLELCTLHLQESASLERLLTFLQFGDGCAAALVSAEPHGFELVDFQSLLFPEGHDEIAWRIQDAGFDMILSMSAPQAIGDALRQSSPRIFKEVARADIEMWAVHPGGRAILDAVEACLELSPSDLAVSRNVLARYGNMSSPTVLFVLNDLLRQERRAGGYGCAMAFGPGLTAETLIFRDGQSDLSC